MLQLCLLEGTYCAVLTEESQHAELTACELLSPELEAVLLFIAGNLVGQNSFSDFSKFTLSA
jgi:hypothetical protein